MKDVNSLPTLKTCLVFEQRDEHLLRTALPLFPWKSGRCRRRLSEDTRKTENDNSLLLHCLSSFKRHHRLLDIYLDLALFGESLKENGNRYTALPEGSVMF